MCRRRGRLQPSGRVRPEEERMDTRGTPGPAGPSSFGHPAGPVFTPLGAEDPREVGGYLLRARIGEGGMGADLAVWEAGCSPGGLEVRRTEITEAHSGIRMGLCLGRGGGIRTHGIFVSI